MTPQRALPPAEVGCGWWGLGWGQGGKWALAYYHGDRGADKKQVS